MNPIIGTAWSFREAGGVPSHVEVLTRGLTDRHIPYALVNPAERFHSPLWKAVALAAAGGRPDRGRVRLSQFRLRDLRRKLAARLTTGGHDLIHVHDVLAGSVAVKLGLPVVVTIHGPLTREARMMAGEGSRDFIEFVRACEQTAYDGAAVLIAVDNGQRDAAVQDFGVTADKIEVIYNAVDTTAFAPRTVPHPPATFFLLARRLVKKNGVAVAVEAFRSLRGRPLELWLAGDGPERPNLEAQVREAGLTGQVRFLGSVGRETMVQLVNQAAALVVPSVPVQGVVEASSIAALEGMSAAKPVLASDLGGLREMIRSGETGFLFPAGEAAALAQLYDTVLAGDPAVLQAVGLRARSYVEQHHSMAAWLDQVLRVYNRAMGA